MIECLKSLYRINYPNHDAIRLHQPDDVIDSTFSLSNSERNMGKFLRLLHKRKLENIVEIRYYKWKIIFKNRVKQKYGRNKTD